VEADVLAVDLHALLPPATTADVVGNLPYYITSDILLRLFAEGARDVLSRAVLMMQREVADRVCAAPGSRDYGLLSVTVQMYGEVEKLFTLPPNTGQRCTMAYTMPGTRTSRPNCALPSVFGGMSLRGTG